VATLPQCELIFPTTVSVQLQHNVGTVIISTITTTLSLHASSFVNHYKTANK